MLTQGSANLLRRTTVFLAALICASPVVAGTKLVGTVDSIPRNSFTAGGLLASNTNRSLNNAVSETGVSSFTGSSFRLHSGLMNIIAQPGSVVAITAATKTTGTLELSWSAPGLDGFLGSVNGYYRIDASSDPLHAFRPARFITEFSTSVVPGDAQSYVLDNLLANTTYYARIYLSDLRKVVAEDSNRSDESTLANVPDPAFERVWASSVTISWTLPARGAEGYQLDASSTNFGALFPGGMVTTSKTAEGLVVNLTIEGLDGDTTYYFKLASLSWQSDVNYSAIVATRTMPGGPMPVRDLRLLADNVNRTVLLSWTNSRYLDPLGVTVLVSTSPISVDPVTGTGYPAGYAFADGSVVKDPAAGTSHFEQGLTLNVTSYFKLYSRNASNVYSVSVSTFVVLDLPPLMPAGLSAALTPDGSSITITWGATRSNIDGSIFKDILAPSGWELDRYEIYRATSIARAGWTLAASTPCSAPGASAAVPEPGRVYYYKVVSRDSFAGGWTDESMAVDTRGNLYAVGADQVTRIKVPAELAGQLRAEGNPYGVPLFVRVKERPQDLGGKVVKSVSFDAYQAPTAQPAPLQLAGSGMDVVLRYETAGGAIVPSGAGEGSSGPRAAAALQPSVRASDAMTSLAAYLASGADAIKLYGSVDSYLQTVQVQSSLLGNYQIRTVLRDLGFNFDVSGVTNKVITPNGDGLNDTVVFVFDNPKDSGFSGKVFDAKGAYVSEMRPGPLSRNSLMWDGKSNGGAVSRGVYIYQIKAEDKVHNGTVVVIR
ncbi:MAG: gliding motility-associated C-terminal domain-containing protein [Elusimicrobia bacterium]|nr:gliding motility-associated C-terminal domain-containing protein [Elusimicrobiota bacterium]